MAILLLSFDLRDVNLAPEYAGAIEEKEIARQQAERMQHILALEAQEAERRMVEAEGVRQAAIIAAQGEAEALGLVSQALAENPSLLTYQQIDRLAANIDVVLLPDGAQFIAPVAGWGIWPDRR